MDNLLRKINSDLRDRIEGQPVPIVIVALMDCTCRVLSMTPEPFLALDTFCSAVRAELQRNDADPVNLQGSGPAPIEPREG